MLALPNLYLCLLLFLLNFRLSISFTLVNKIAYRSFVLLQQQQPKDQGNEGVDERKAWKSGRIFSKEPRKSKGSNEPWWMRDEEKNNPRVLPPYKPWWSKRSALVDSSWKVEELKKEAMRRDLYIKGSKKDELISILQESSSRYDISDKGFVSPNYVDKTRTNAVPTCYPESYENEESLKSLHTMALRQPPPS